MLNMLHGCFSDIFFHPWSPLVSLLVFPLIFTVAVVMRGIQCLLENFAFGLTRVSWERLKQRRSVIEAVTAFLHATLAAIRKHVMPTYCTKAHPPAYACLCKTNRRAHCVVSSARNLPLHPDGWFYHRFTKACWHFRLCSTHLRHQHEAAICAKGINI